MSGTRILIAATSRIETESRRDFVKLWWRVNAVLNPGVDIILIDTCSPFDPAVFLPETEIYRFDDNIGTLSHGQRDGSGRAFMKALEFGVLRGYDYVVHWETDLLFAKPVTPVIERMHRSGIKAASFIANPYAFCEWAICFFNCQFVKESKFIERYDWANAPAWPIPEWRIESLLGDDLWLLPIRGMRNSLGNVNAANLHQFFPYGPPDYLTHITDFTLAYKFLELNQIHVT